MTMKLWILRPIKPWEPWYDRTFGLLISAKSEENARKLAAENCSDGDTPDGNVWLNPELTTCKILEPAKVQRIIMRDFHAA